MSKLLVFISSMRSNDHVRILSLKIVKQERREVRELTLALQSTSPSKSHKSIKKHCCHIKISIVQPAKHRHQC